MTRTYCDVCGRDCEQSFEDKFEWRKSNCMNDKIELTVCRDCSDNMLYFIENKEKFKRFMSLPNRLRFLFKLPMK